jgi:hypothetical protein
LNARLLRPERSALPSWATSRRGTDDIKFISKCPLFFINNPIYLKQENGYAGYST